MTHGVNANLVRRWVIDAERSSSGALARTANSAVPTTFVPLQLPPVEAAPVDIRIELRRGATVINVSWPCAAASECAVWVRAVLR